MLGSQKVNAAWLQASFSRPVTESPCPCTFALAPLRLLRRCPGTSSSHSWGRRRRAQLSVKFGLRLAQFEYGWSVKRIPGVNDRIKLGVSVVLWLVIHAGR